MIRPDDTIVLPQRSTRADGIDPDIAKGDGERAIFCYPGVVVDNVVSCAWIAQTDVRLAKAIAVDSSNPEGQVRFKINDVLINESLVLAGNQQLTFTGNHVLRAEVDTLKVYYLGGDEGAAFDLSVFVSFTKADPL